MNHNPIPPSSPNPFPTTNTGGEGSGAAPLATTPTLKEG